MLNLTGNEDRPCLLDSNVIDVEGDGADNKINEESKNIPNQKAQTSIRVCD